MLYCFLCYCLATDKPLVLKPRRGVNFDVVAVVQDKKPARGNDGSETIVSQRTSRRSVRSSVVASEWELYRQAVLDKAEEIRKHLTFFVDKDYKYVPAETYVLFSASLTGTNEQLDECLLSLQGLKAEFEAVGLQQEYKRSLLELITKPGPKKLKEKKAQIVKTANLVRNRLLRVLSEKDSKVFEAVCLPKEVLDFLSSKECQLEDINEDTVLECIYNVNNTIRILSGVLNSIRICWPDYYASKTSFQKNVKRINVILSVLGLDSLENNFSSGFLERCPDPIERIVVEVPVIPGKVCCPEEGSSSTVTAEEPNTDEALIDSSAGILAEDLGKENLFSKNAS